MNSISPVNCVLVSRSSGISFALPMGMMVKRRQALTPRFIRVSLIWGSSWMLFWFTQVTTSKLRRGEAAARAMALVTLS